MTAKIATGQCLCGAVRFEARGSPLWVAHCHCRSCRRATGSALATFVGFQCEQVSYVVGKRAVYQSSKGVRRSFCPICGTPLSYEADRFQGEIHLYLGTFNDADQFRPQAHVYHAEHLPWLELHDALPRFEGLSGGRNPDSWGPAKR